MIYELVKENGEFGHISSLVADYKNHPIVNGVVYGENKGHIYIDDANNPSCALIWAQSRYSSCFIPKPYTRIQFTFDRLYYTTLAKPILPNGVTVNQISVDMLTNETFAMVRDDIESFWPSIHDFLRLGFGYVVMVNNQAVSSCLSVFAWGSDVEVGINTYDLRHRASKVGFTTRQAYTAYVFAFNQQDNFVFSAYHQLRNYSDSRIVTKFERKAGATGNLNAWHHFLLACGYSLINRIDVSLQHMNQALKLGWNDVSDIRYVVDLVNLRKTEEGRALLESLELTLA